MYKGVGCTVFVDTITMSLYYKQHYKQLARSNCSNAGFLAINKELKDPIRKKHKESKQ